MLTVGYYTSTNLLDAAIETIQCIKYKVKLHVFIEITNHSKSATIIDIPSIDEFTFIEDPVLILGKEKWDKIKSFFYGVSSVQFVLFKKSKNISFETIFSGIRFGRFINKLRIDVFHFDTVSLRAIGFLPFIIRKKIIITLHDALPHLGENSWKEKLLTKVFYRFADGFIFYSSYSMNQFKNHFKNINKHLYRIFLQPYSFNRLLKKNFNATENNYVLFFGRQSYYKGIDLFLKAIPLVLDKNPNLSFYVVGKKVFNYQVEKDQIENIKDHLKIISNHIPSEALVDYIIHSKFIVCPYRDASQSGVLMTATSLRKMTIATNVGAFNEYIQDGFNGLLCEPNAISLANKINEALLDNKYLEIENNVNPYYSSEKSEINASRMMKCYLS